MNIRRPAVAGLFYPAEPETLRERIATLLNQAVPRGAEAKALVVPHAGIQFSGPVAARAYAGLERSRGAIRRVVLLGPSHHVHFDGIAASSAEAWETPLGRVPISHEAVETALSLPAVSTLDAAHQREHSLEVQLPFLQLTLTDFELAPFVIGDASAEQVSLVLETLWGGPETLIVISSDLSHFHNAAAARRLDAETARLIDSRQLDQLDARRACGFRGIQGLLSAMSRRNLHIECVDLRNSGDIAGGTERVVGYGAWLAS